MTNSHTRHDSGRPLGVAATIDGGRAARTMAIIATQLAVLAALLWVVLGAAVAHADEVDNRDARLLAYAEPLPERFAMPFDDQRGLEQPFVEEGHPLNDAWMGLNVVTSDGRIVGYVSDAFIGPDGAVDEIIVTPPQDGPLANPVYVPAAEVTLTGYDVRVTATLAELGAYEPVTEDLAGFID